MLTVSNDFKKSVSATEREMKGYVEVIYTLPNIEKSPNELVIYPTILNINGTDLSPAEVSDDDRKGKNYATLEQDYFKLDGTFVLPNNDATKNPGIGYVSEDLFEDITGDVKFQFTPTFGTSQEKICNGMTFYFQNNQPLEFDLKIIYVIDDTTEPITFGTLELTQDDAEIMSNGAIMFKFDPISVFRGELQINDMLYTNRRIRLQEIDFGLSAVYENEELISFKTIEQCDRFADTMPINECEITLGDFNGKFDITNPKGITDVLNENVVIKPFVGVVTEDNGIEYCSKGTYWLKDWNYNGKQAVLNGQSVFGKLLDMDYTKLKQVEGRDPFVTEWLNYKSEKWGVEFDLTLPYTASLSNYISDEFAKVDTKLNTLQKMIGYCGGVLNQTRDGKIKYLYIYLGSEEGFERLEQIVMKDYANIKNNDPINTLSVTEYIYNDPSSELETFYENTIQSNDIVELYIPFDDYKAVQFPYTENCTVLESNFELQWLYDTYVYLKLQCNGNAKVVLQGYSYKNSKTENKVSINQVGKEIKIENDFYSTNGTLDIRYYSNNYIEYQKRFRPKRSIKVSFNGLPHYETGDIIHIEGKKYGNYTPFYMTYITRIESEFNGSYRETIEGDVIEN